MNSTSPTTSFSDHGAQSFQLILPIGHPDNPFPAARTAIGYRFENSKGGSESETKVSRAVFGAKGTAGNWDWESAYLFNKSDRDETFFGRLYLPTLLKVMNQGMTLNAANASGTATKDITNRNTSQVSQFDAKGTTEFGSLPGGAIGLAVGLEARQEKIILRPDAETVAGNIVGLVNSFLDASRNVQSTFIEMRTPWLKNFEMDYAARYDKYPNLKGNIVPKVGAKWAVTPNFSLRATYAEGFRAPALSQISKGGSQYFDTVTDPLRCPDGVNPVPGADTTDCAKSIGGASIGNPDLKPETSKSYNFGLIWSVNKDVDVVLDVYDIKKKNETALQSSDFVVNHADLYAAQIQRNPNQASWIKDAAGNLIPNSGPLTYVAAPWVNQGSTEVMGMDLELAVRKSLGEYGNLNSKANFGYTQKYLRAENQGDRTANIAGSQGGISDWATSSGNIPHWRSNASTEWSKGPHKVTASVNYVGTISLLRRSDNTDVYPVPYCYYGTGQPSSAYSLGGLAKFSNWNSDCNISSWTTYDMNYAYTGIKDLTISVNIQNVFDTPAPYYPTTTASTIAAGTNTALFNNTGRYFRIAASYKFK
jgi:iron complex outermembrane receptor protein